MNDDLGSEYDDGAANTLRVELTTLSDVGKVRTENQDFVTATVEQDEAEGMGQIIIVADGMGGHQGGATASEMAATTVKQVMLESRDREIDEALREALAAANTRIHHAASSNQALQGMGTTTSTMVFHDSKLYIGHVGDSRIYRIRNGQIEQLTEDHSLVATMVKQGLISEEEAENHPRRNVLQRSMGVSEEVEVDIYGPHNLEIGDIFLGCSDGLHGQMTEEEILRIITSNDDLDAIARILVDLALERGAPDNVTVGLARVVEGGPAVPLRDRSEKAEADVDPDPADQDDSDPARTLETEEAATGNSPPPKATPAGCLLQLLLLTLLALVVGGALMMLIDEQRVISLFSG